MSPYSDAADLKTGQATEAEKNQAAGACELWVKESLHDPSSARFELAFFFERKKTYDRVQIHVRARNLSNALQLAVFECHISSKDGNLRLLSIKQIR